MTVQKIKKVLVEAQEQESQLILDPQDAIRSARELVAQNFIKDGLRRSNVTAILFGFGPAVTTRSPMMK